MTGSHEMVGTLQYMSPEQLSGNPQCDTRSDVYGLGLTFYELIAFRLPLEAAELREQPLDVAIRRIRTEDPLLPSLLLTQCELGEGNGVITSRIRRLRGDLDWIVMKSIDRDPDHRYQSAAMLAEDIRRHIAGDVIAAAPPSLRIKAGKWIRKHRGWCAAGASLASLVVIVGGVIVWLLSMTLAANRDLALRTYIGQVQIAEDRLRRGHTAEAIEILQRLRDAPSLSPLRGLEWKLLWRETHPDELLDQFPAFHNGVDDVAVSSRSQVAALSRSEQRIRCFQIDANHLRPDGQLSSDDLRLAAPEIAAHWKQRATGADQRRVDSMTWGRNPQPLISCLAYTPDGTTTRDWRC
ncbi:Serine/threonine-protein kinase PknB [Stieleria maiorica]|uniref:Serine/threonine-protein kinase PknB n=2 Tax=Stieleria maiorica TaxID=2795974 RepID=A0A5B9MB16_9BACT|nr:Serine/threonine-protein kinase PknB [Stieleria maiorica]